MPDEFPRKLGPYELLELIGKGGMAEVYRARRDGPGGFQKDLALKRILPRYSRNRELVQRFMEEARIAGALIHGNIIQVYDFGFAEGEYYIVMEYIDGLSLADVLDLSVDTGIPLPSPLVAYIGAEVCDGLAYAHALTDESGQEVEVVHRDVSPQNILLSRAGDVKLGDFGIVKAADSLIRTEAGLRLGKLNYMSPEQANGDKLDGRSDLFSLGVTLWEALTLRPLLPRNDPAAALEKLRTCDFPKISTFRRDTHVELEEIIERALRFDRESRYPDGHAMARELRAFVHATVPGFGRQDLIEYLDWLRPRTSRVSGVAPPVPPSLTSRRVREDRRGRDRRSNRLAWMALFASPLLGLAFGALSFGTLWWLQGDRAAARTTAPPHWEASGLTGRSPGNGPVAAPSSETPRTPAMPTPTVSGPSPWGASSTQDAVGRPLPAPRPTPTPPPSPQPLPGQPLPRPAAIPTAPSPLGTPPFPAPAPGTSPPTGVSPSPPSQPSNPNLPESPTATPGTPYPGGDSAVSEPDGDTRPLPDRRPGNTDSRRNRRRPRATSERKPPHR